MDKRVAPDAGGVAPTVPPPFTQEELRRLSLGEIARELGVRVRILARRQVDLARAEARVDLRRGLWAGGLAGLAGFLLIGAFICGLFAALVAIGRSHPPVDVGLIGLAIFGGAAILVGAAAALEGRSARPKRTIRQARGTVGLLRPPSRATP